MDPTRFDPTLALFAWIHPVLIGASLLAALVVYTTGLRLREVRTRNHPAQPGTRRLHTRLGRPVVLLLVGGFATGPVSSVFVRDWPLLSTFHGWTGIGAVTAFAVAGLLGLRLHDHRSQRATLHGLLALLGMAWFFRRGPWAAKIWGR